MEEEQRSRASAEPGAWVAWHDAYDRPGSGLARRLAVVRRRIGEVSTWPSPAPRRRPARCASSACAPATGATFCPSWPPGPVWRCVRATVGAVPSLLARGGTVIWTRGRPGGEDDLRPVIRRWFSDAGLTEVAFDGGPGDLRRRRRPP